MSVHIERRTGRFLVRQRDRHGKHHTITVNPANLKRFGLAVPEKITKWHAGRLDREVALAFGGEAGDGGLPASPESEESTVGEAIEEYLATELPAEGFSKSHRDRVRLSLEHYLSGVVPKDTLLSDVDGTAINRLRASLQRRGLSKVSVRAYFDDIKTFFKWCLVGSGKIARSPFDAVKAPPKSHTEVKYLRQAEVARLLAAAAGSPLEGPVVGILNTGARKSEFAGLRWSDFNFEQGIVRIRGSKTPQAVRQVPLTETLSRYLSRFERPAGLEEHAFTNSDGEPWTASALSSALARFNQESGLEFPWNFQVLRATYGSLLALKGIPLAHVAQLLGHSDVRITQRWYVGLAAEDIAAPSASVLDSIFAAASPPAGGA